MCRASRSKVIGSVKLLCNSQRVSTCNESMTTRRLLELPQLEVTRMQKLGRHSGAVKMAIFGFSLGWYGRIYAD